MFSQKNVPLIELINAGVEFNGVRRIPGITFNVTRGEFVCLHGSTGSGKSIALSMIAGLTRPSFGEVRVAGELINDFTQKEMMMVRRSMGIMLQECLLLNDRTVLENVMLPCIAGEESYAEAKRRALKALSDCGVEHLAGLTPLRIAAGQKQLVTLARAIVNRPKVVLADEPAAHLDADNAQMLIDHLGRVSLSGISVIVASHLALTPSNVACRSINLNEDPEAAL